MFHFDKNFGLFIGQLITNEFHKHYALQISVALNNHLKLAIKGNKELTGSGFYISSNVEHKLTSQETQLTILINLLSPLGHYLYLNFGQIQISSISKELEQKLIANLRKLIKTKIDFNSFCSSISENLHQFKYSCENDNHSKDDRIIKALNILDANFEKIYSGKPEGVGICGGRRKPARP